MLVKNNQDTVSLSFVEWASTAQAGDSDLRVKCARSAGSLPDSVPCSLHCLACWQDAELKFLESGLGHWLPFAPGIHQSFSVTGNMEPRGGETGLISSECTNKVTLGGIPGTDRGAFEKQPLPKKVMLTETISKALSADLALHKVAKYL